MTDDRPDDVMAAADVSVTTHPRQPAGITWLARALLAGAIGLVAVAVLLPNTWLAELRLRWRWFSEAINRVEALWPALDMVHVLMFAAVGVLAALAFPAWSRWRLLMAITTGLAALIALKWGFSPILVVAVNGFFLLIDLVFFSANLPKLHEGGWYPLVLALVLVVVNSAAEQAGNGEVELRLLLLMALATLGFAWSQRLANLLTAREIERVLRFQKTTVAPFSESFADFYEDEDGEGFEIDYRLTESLILTFEGFQREGTLQIVLEDVIAEN